MISPYLDRRSLLPLAVALLRMLAQIEADLATAGPAATGRLQPRRVRTTEVLVSRCAGRG
jgi:hypothetical protein